MGTLEPRVSSTEKSQLCQWCGLGKVCGWKNWAKES